MSMFPDLSPHDVLVLLAQPNAPAVLDIRIAEDHAADPTRLPAATQVAYDDVTRQLTLCNKRGAIVVCHKGQKLSAGVTARLRGHGVTAHRLSGGHVAWRTAGFPVLATPPTERIAIPLDATPTEALAAWAHLRFDSPDAEILEAPRTDLPGVIARFAATLPRPAPDLPGLSQLSPVMDALTLALRAAPATACFPILDLAYKGAVCHETVTGRRAAQAVSGPKETRP